MRTAARLLLAAMVVALLAIAIAVAVPAKAHADDRPVGGWTLELGTGVVNYDSTVTVGGVKLVDQGGDAFAAPVFRVGYGWTRNALYIGMEGDATLLSGRSRAVVNGQAYSYDPSYVVGGYARVGVVRGASMLYVRAGAQAWESDVVPAVGVGVEIPFGRFYFRLDVTYSWNDTERTVATGALGLRF